VDSSWNGSGVSETRGSANPVAVFIAEAVLGATSKRASAEAAAVCRLLVVGETVHRHGAWWTRCGSRGVGVEVSVAVLIDIGSRYFHVQPSATAHLVRPLRAGAVSVEEARHLEGRRGRLHHARANIGVLSGAAGSRRADAEQARSRDYQTLPSMTI
jgi:hypothetical protein